MSSRFSRRPRPIGPPAICLKPPPKPPRPGVPPIESIALNANIVWEQWSGADWHPKQWANVLPITTTNPWTWYMTELNQAGDEGDSSLTICADSSGLWSLVFEGWAWSTTLIHLLMPPRPMHPTWPSLPSQIHLISDNEIARGVLATLEYFP